MWQAWHLATSTSTLRGRRGTYGIGLANRGRAWARFGLRWRRGTLRGKRGTWRHASTFVSRGRRGTWRHLPPLCVAGVALMALGWLTGGALGPVLVAGGAAALCVAGAALGDIHLRFTWQAWHLATSTSTWQAWRYNGTGLALARLGPFWSPVTPRHFAWQAWHLATSTFVSRGRRGTWRHEPPLCVADVALMALGWLGWRAWARFGRR